LEFVPWREEEEKKSGGGVGSTARLLPIGLGSYTPSSVLPEPEDLEIPSERLVEGEARRVGGAAVRARGGAVGEERGEKDRAEGVGEEREEEEEDRAGAEKGAEAEAGGGGHGMWRGEEETREVGRSGVQVRVVDCIGDHEGSMVVRWGPEDL